MINERLTALAVIAILAMLMVFTRDRAPNCSGAWYLAGLTTYESYPEPGSAECIDYKGCLWEGQFFGLDGKHPEDWVASQNIVAVHSKDWDWLGMKALRLRQGAREIEVQVYDLCADSDCEGCCTDSLAGDGYLIDMEKYTVDRFGSENGLVEFQLCER